MLKMRAPLLNDFYVQPRIRYTINLPLQMAECEANYVRLQNLMQIADTERELAINHGATVWLHKISLVERSRYTTTLKLTQSLNSSTLPCEQAKVTAWLQMPCLTVRMYHDAKLAEVLAWEGHRRLRPRYDYPNQAMYQRDEKLQINQFLGEWLSLCLQQGCSTGDVMRLIKK